MRGNGLLGLAGSWGPVLIWMGFIFALSAQSSVPHAPSDLVDLLLKKSAHAGGYAVLAMLLCRALAVEPLSTAPGPAVRTAAVRTVVAVAIALAYAISDEFHQSFVPDRTPSPVDALLDLVGALVGTAGYHWLSHGHGRYLDR